MDFIKPSNLCLRKVKFLYKKKQLNSFINCSNTISIKFQSFRLIHSIKDNNNKTASTSWIDSSIIPNKIKPYLHLIRADKQIGSWLLFWPCCWSVALATPLNQLPDFLLLAKFLTGAIIMRGAGCIINDIWDKDFDKNVERTKARPLASGQLTVPQALTFLGLQLSLGLGVLVTFNPTTIYLGLCSMPLVIIYPLMKRYTYWPQLVLGLAFNWGALVGWTAVYDSISLTHMIPLYISGVCWTLVYDTIYGYQDIDDDRKLGLKSTALYLGRNPQWPLTFISGISCGSLALAGFEANLSYPFYIGVVGIGSHLLWQIWTIDIFNRSNLWNSFSSNKYTGLAISLAIISGHF